MPRKVRELVKDLERAFFSKLRDIVEDAVRLCENEGRPMPEPMSGREFVNALQQVA